MKNNKVRVYWNFHKKLWSVLKWVPKKGWRLDRHTSNICLNSAEFIVYNSGRLRVIREEKKNVHAFVEGIHIKNFDDEFATWQKGISERLKFHPVTYNPYKNKTFITKYGHKIKEACHVCLVSINNKAIVDALF